MKTVQVLLSSPEGKWHGTACIHPRLPSPASLQSPPPKMTCSLTPSVSGSCSLPNHIPDITIQSESKGAREHTDSTLTDWTISASALVHVQFINTAVAREPKLAVEDVFASF